MENKPEILAPAGDPKALLAAFAAGADAVYLGLKHFSARMESQNFSLSELSRLVELAHREDRKIFVALNTLLKPEDPPLAGKLIAKLNRDVHPDALIVQDPGTLETARQAGYEGEVFISTLANVTHPMAFEPIKQLGFARVILPRELSLDEIRYCGQHCPEGLTMEVFIHGALCYCVSGRCYWSSYMGGKSGLRGRCVQPCRRMYQQKGRSARFFSCMDFSLGEQVPELLKLPKVASWKIEGRKKGPHYVYHVVAAYKLLRDNPGDPKAAKEGERLLSHALGRPRTQSLFIPGRPQSPAQPGGQTGSGLFVGKVAVRPAKGRKRGGKPASSGGLFLKTRLALANGDFLRVGYQDQPWHFTTRVGDRVGKGEDFPLKAPPQKNPKPGAPVFLLDRRGPQLTKKLKQWQAKLEECPGRQVKSIDFQPVYPRPDSHPRPSTITVGRSLSRGGGRRKDEFQANITGLWLTPGSFKSVSKMLFPRLWWWLPPVIWPNEEESWARILSQALRKGARRFVLGAPWQVAFFKNQDLELLAGPFCNPSNPAELTVYQQMGITGAIVSPELSGQDMLDLPGTSPLPLGVVLSGYWPMGITRLPMEGVKLNEPFTSPQNETFWARKHGQNTWIYPAWPLDISQHKEKLLKAGYSWFVVMAEEPPRNAPPARRNSQFNWDLKLL